ncbi:MAG: DNA replication and repair protein RecF [Anaerolineaceae bacterium]|jgi:DNA replication and repair protein RecF|nr:DNA replication and repair protein RecF [Anaerolineaceae bacterium]
MFLTHLSLTNFRAFTRLDMDVPRRILMLVGDNAQGKTSLLEAVYFLATFTSFHAQNDRQLIHFLALHEQPAVTRLVADYERDGRKHKLEIRLILDGNGGRRLRKEILVDGVRRTAQKAIGEFNAVIYLPQMTRILEDGPDQRRRYLNLALTQVVPGYAQALSKYNHTIIQRNALLKLLAERGGDRDQLVYWDELLTRSGAMLIKARIDAIDEMEAIAAKIHLHLTGDQEVLRFVYQPAYDPLPEPEDQFALPFTTPADRSAYSRDDLQEGFTEKLAALHGEEIVRGVTTVGPHRDELRVLANGIDLGSYGSRGQVRTALLSLKLAEVSWMREKTGTWPVLLLDEILAELDAKRRQDLLDYLADSEQTLMTTTDVNLFAPAFVEASTVWQIDAGRVTA